MANDLIRSIADVGGPALVALAFALALAESAILLDLLVPGEVGLVIVGAAAAEAGAPLWMIVVAAAVGAVAGDSIGFWLGRRFGPGIVQRFRWTRRNLQPRLDRATRYFERRGGISVAVARWIGALRAVVPVVAGAATYPYRSFVAWDAPSAALWATAIAGLGFFFGDDVASFVDRAATAVSLVAVAAIVAWFLLRRRRRRTAG